MDIRVDDLSAPEITAFLEQYLQDLQPTAPAVSRHALDLSGLRVPQMTLWTLWGNGAIGACGAIKALDTQQEHQQHLQHAELRSTHTAGGLKPRTGRSGSNPALSGKPPGLGPQYRRSF